MVAIRRRMPLLHLGVASVDGRRFDALESARLPAPIEDPGNLDELLLAHREMADDRRRAYEKAGA